MANSHKSPITESGILGKQTKLMNQKQQQRQEILNRASHKCGGADAHMRDCLRYINTAESIHRRDKMKYMANVADKINILIAHLDHVIDSYIDDNYNYKNQPDVAKECYEKNTVSNLPWTANNNDREFNARDFFAGNEGGRS